MVPNLRDILDIKKAAANYDTSLNWLNRCYTKPGPLGFIFRFGLESSVLPRRIALIWFHAIKAAHQEIKQCSLSESGRVFLQIFVLIGRHIFQAVMGRTRVITCIHLISSSRGIASFQTLHSELRNTLYRDEANTLFPGYHLTGANEAHFLDHVQVRFGQSLWLAALYLHLLKKEEDPEMIFRSLSTLYTNGSDEAPLVLETLNKSFNATPNKSLFNTITSLFQTPSIYNHLFDLVKVTGKERIDIKATSTEILGFPLKMRIEEKSEEKIKHLKPGCYFIPLSKDSSEGSSDAVTYIKATESLGFIFDPDKGFSIYKGENHWRGVIDCLKRYPGFADNIHFIRLEEKR